MGPKARGGKQKTACPSEDPRAEQKKRPTSAISPDQPDMDGGSLHEDFTPRTKKHTTPLAQHIAEAAEMARKHGNVTPVTPFPVREYSTFEEFFDDWTAYAKAEYLSTRRHHSITRDAANRKIKERYDSEEARAKYMIPEHLSYSIAVYRCTHGCVEKGRGDGLRFHAETRYMGCLARITASAVRDARLGSWHVRAYNHIATHNHRVSEFLYDADCNLSFILEEQMFRTAAALGECKAKTKWVTDFMSRSLGVTFTSRQWANFKTHQYGGDEALKSMKRLLYRFTRMLEVRCLVIQAERGHTCGVRTRSIPGLDAKSVQDKSNNTPVW